jgi:ABC-type bacteriocin/lantibiotic exporter with double-glycine peptidase domain
MLGVIVVWTAYTIAARKGPLMRFRERTGGDIAINGLPIEDIATHSLRSIETMISQDTFILDDTVAHNIAIARPHATREDIESAAHDAHLDDVLAELPGGLDHRLTRNGSELSEGQRQRIAVARAFLSDAGLLLLDEPTSNMDALLEGQIMDALMSHQEGRSYLIVTHRDAVLARADRILTMSDGKLTPATPVIKSVEPGTSAEPSTTGADSTADTASTTKTAGTATAAGDDTDITTTANANEGRP